MNTEMVGKRVAVNWHTSKDQYAEYSGWIVGDQGQKHIVVYDELCVQTGRRVYAHRLSDQNSRLLEGNLANGSIHKDWTPEDDATLVRLQKEISNAENEVQSFLWCAAACTLGRLRERRPGRRTISDQYDSLRHRFSVLAGKVKQNSGRKQLAPTGVTTAQVQNALQKLPSKTGTMKEIVAKFEEIYGLGDRTVAPARKRLTRQQIAVMNQVAKHPNQFAMQKVDGKRATYILFEP
eukprot:TRINITY_DN109793_c0_g1_i1.p1 TRINITY_DN109793_c0_g1~~TRINITY_DN109793_c0_g1_i1.p1  ORF type:complete len:236 (-),score=40.15 TRINITY_DN109793_c0_g1_i1:23-730(-)